eukprot:1160811-Pelagomonas_calceolata.AAC.8
MRAARLGKRSLFFSFSIQVWAAALPWGPNNEPMSLTMGSLDKCTAQDQIGQTRLASYDGDGGGYDGFQDRIGQTGLARYDGDGGGKDDFKTRLASKDAPARYPAANTLVCRGGDQNIFIVENARAAILLYEENSPGKGSFV